MKSFSALILLIFFSIQIYSQEKANHQAQAFRKNNITTIKKFILKTSLISISKGDRLLTENHHHADGLIRETKILRNNDLMATYIYQYIKT